MTNLPIVEIYLGGTPKPHFAWSAVLHEISSVIERFMTEKVEKPHLKDKTTFCRITAPRDSTNTEQPVLQIAIYTITESKVYRLAENWKK